MSIRDKANFLQQQLAGTAPSTGASNTSTTPGVSQDSAVTAKLREKYKQLAARFNPFDPNTDEKVRETLLNSPFSPYYGQTGPSSTVTTTTTTGMYGASSSQAYTTPRVDNTRVASTGGISALRSMLQTSEPEKLEPLKLGPGAKAVFDAMGVPLPPAHSTRDDLKGYVALLLKHAESLTKQRRQQEAVNATLKSDLKLAQLQLARVEKHLVCSMGILKKADASLHDKVRLAIDKDLVAFEGVKQSAKEELVERLSALNPSEDPEGKGEADTSDWGDETDDNESGLEIDADRLVAFPGRGAPGANLPRPAGSDTVTGPSGGFGSGKSTGARMSTMCTPALLKELDERLEPAMREIVLQKVKIMYDGSCFLQFPPKSIGKPIRRNVFFRDSDQFGPSLVLVSAGEPLSSSSAQHLQLKHLTDIYMGKQSSQFRRHVAKRAKDGRCFSIVGGGVGVGFDFEARSAEQRDAWVVGLLGLTKGLGNDVTVHRTPRFVSDPLPRMHPANVQPITFQMSVRCRDLPRVAKGKLMRRRHPLVRLFEKDPQTGVFHFVAQTETVESSILEKVRRKVFHPQFDKKLQVNYYPGSEQEMALTVSYHPDHEKLKYRYRLGVAQFKLADLVRSPGIDLSLPLENLQKKSFHRILQQMESRVIARVSKSSQVYNILEYHNPALRNAMALQNQGSGELKMSGASSSGPGVSSSGPGAQSNINQLLGLAAPAKPKTEVKSAWGPNDISSSPPASSGGDVMSQLGLLSSGPPVPKLAEGIFADVSAKANGPSKRLFFFVSKAGIGDRYMLYANESGKNTVDSAPGANGRSQLSFLVKNIISVDVDGNVAQVSLKAGGGMFLRFDSPAEAASFRDGINDP